MGITSHLRELFEKAARTADKAKQLWRKAWKESFSCFPPIGSLTRRQWSRQKQPAEAAETDPDAREDDHLVEDRPLLKHRLSAGFPARQKTGARMQARAQELGSQVMQKSQAVSKKVCAQASSLGRGMHRSIPTPLRIRRSQQDSGRGDSECSGVWEDVSIYEDEDDIFEIGSDDEEEQPFLTRAVSIDEWPPALGPREETSTNQGVAAKVPCLAFESSGKGRSDGTPCLMTPHTPKQNVFYVGTPRDCA
mmetsp:Transcript_44394/g.78046  ORF Transcript_44394/g.78046 Transcript_44394/m.78046 type:complete len:250 (-) Transcript_44394:87-836(-)